jgi:type III restriction enzyme
MKLKFKVQPYQTNAVESVVDCFAGQVDTSGIVYRIDPGVGKRDSQGRHQASFLEQTGFKNSDIQMTDAQLLTNIQAVQRRQNLRNWGRQYFCYVLPEAFSPGLNCAHRDGIGDVAAF